ncbi:DUF192 domain-containing protein [Halorussus lipolyticus]|uniref:DUF192 domain-containing protein n=1 Tax=Halorussus lipolyticus TaxID=3034024 RepID=UPI0023E778B9|nr:DUF192 domain-containing protein [Halorussus sp. DT80]
MRPHAVLLVGALVVLAGCMGGIGGTGDGSLADANRQADSPAPPTTTDVERVVNATFVVEDEENATVSLMVADEPDERRSGLMHRESLANDTGMVFVYPNARQVSFWMKNTLIPLDMIFVAENGTVLNVQHASVQPNASTGELANYPSDGPAKYVVELPRGFANRTGVGPGSKLVFDDDAPTATE